MDTCTGSRNQWNIKAWILKMYSRSAKGGEKADPNRNPWLAKMHVDRPSVFILSCLFKKGHLNSRFEKLCRACVLCMLWYVSTLNKTLLFNLDFQREREKGYQSSGTVPNEGHKITTGKFWVGSVNLFIGDRNEQGPSRPWPLDFGLGY